MTSNSITATAIKRLKLIIIPSWYSVLFFQYHTHSLFRFDILISMIPHIAINWSISIGITSIINLIYLDGGFIVIGWCKKGEVNDRSNRDISVVADAGHNNTHPIYIVPTHSDDIALTRFEGKRNQDATHEHNNSLKYKVASIQR